MATTLEWEGHRIELRCFLSPRYVFMAGESVVLVDGKPAGRAGGFRFAESAAGTFEHDGNPTRIEFEVRNGFFTSARADYVLRIGGKPVSQGKVAIGRTGAGCLVRALLVVAFLGALCLVLLSLSR